MYEAFFGLTLEPFSIAPDPRFLFLSDKHTEALALLNHGVSRGASFVMLTGEIGAGKTTVWRRFLASLPPNFDVANVVNPRLGVEALLTRVCEDLRVQLPAGGGAVDLIDVLHGHLLLAHAQGRRTLIVIDEAQALSAAVMEQLRLLTNLDSSGRKLHVLLIGQPELRAQLQQPQLEPLAQRIVARYHLTALAPEETAAYVEHRLKVAGFTGRMPFDAASLALVHRLSGGIPRRINILCDRALTHAFAEGQRGVDRHAVAKAAEAAFGRPLNVPAARPSSWRSAAWPAGWAIAGMAAGSVAVGAWLRAGPFASSPAPAAPAMPVAAQVVAAAPPPSPVAVPAPPPIPAAPKPGLDAVFDAPAAADEAAAWRALADRWGVRLPTDDPCAAAPALSLYCYRSRDGLAPIRQLDRPGILKLVDPRGRFAYVVLSALTADSAWVNVGGVDLVVPLSRLAQDWRGDFATLWRAPPGYHEGEFAAGDGPFGRWLASQLGRIDGAGSSPGDAASLRERVFAFQLARGLTPDGLAGPLTLMQLNRASGVDEPHLGSVR
jgi:general secretion pathway protein A